jgi:hypothetical protein
MYRVPMADGVRFASSELSDLRHQAIGGHIISPGRRARHGAPHPGGPFRRWAEVGKAGIYGQFQDQGVSDEEHDTVEVRL